MLQLIPPSGSTLEKKIRDIGAATMPTSNSFWFEDIPQIPAKLQSIPFQVITDRVGEPHEIWIDGSLKKRFVPQEASSLIPVVLNKGIYDATLKGPSKEEFKLTFQVSVKELLWWSWIQQLVPMFRNLEVVEARFNSPLHIMAYEVTLPKELLTLQSSQFAIRNYARSSFSGTIKDSFLVLAGGLFNTPVKELERVNTLRDRRADYSQLLLPIPYQCVSRRTAFLASIKDSNRVGSVSWAHAEVAGEDPTRNVLYVPPQVKISLEVVSETGEMIPEEDVALMKPSFMNSATNAIHLKEDFSVYRKDDSKTVIFVSPSIDSELIQNMYLYLSIGSSKYNARVELIPLKGLSNGVYTYSMTIRKKMTGIYVTSAESSNWRILACKDENFSGDVQEILSYRDHLNEICIEGLISQGYFYYRLEGTPRTIASDGKVSYPYKQYTRRYDTNSAKTIYSMGIY